MEPSHIVDAMRNGAVLHFSLVTKAGKSRAARTPIWRLHQGANVATVSRMQVQSLIRHGVIAGAGDTLLPDVVPSQTWHYVDGWKEPNVDGRGRRKTPKAIGNAP